MYYFLLLLQWLEWHPKANVFMLAEKESFCMWRIPTFEVKYFALDSPSQVGCFMPDGEHITKPPLVSIVFKESVFKSLSRITGMMLK